MNPGIDIGERIRLVFKKTGWSVAYFAQQIQKDRTIAYNIFKRKIIDTSLLYDISMALNTDIFPIAWQKITNLSAWKKKKIFSSSGKKEKNPLRTGNHGRRIRTFHEPYIESGTKSRFCPRT